MGVVEAMQHFESSRTIASLNGSHSNVRLGRLPMENEECSFYSQSPKLKRRRISAVRAFPPGCGRFAQINNLRPDKKATSVAESVPIESLISGDKNGDGHEVDKMMLSNGQEDGTDLNNRKDIDTVETIESVTAVEHEISDSPKNIHQLNNLRSVEEAASVGAAEAFICEYIGELLEDKEAEERTGDDEYLFDIGNNYNDGSLWDGLSTLMPDAQSSSYEVVGDGGFTIDAAQYGNVGRFVNHSCSPNLYAQNVLYDHDDTRIPHIMFFAVENIPPLQELTYHYNYMIDQVRDSDGNIKKKCCYCGSAECTGRLY